MTLERLDRIESDARHAEHADSSMPELTSYEQERLTGLVRVIREMDNHATPRFGGSVPDSQALIVVGYERTMDREAAGERSVGGE